MIHQPLISGQIVAPALDIKIHADEIKKTRHELNRILAEATGKTLAQIEEDTDRDYYLNAEESVKYGIADQILNKLTQLPGIAEALAKGKSSGSTAKTTKKAKSTKKK